MTAECPTNAKIYPLHAHTVYSMLDAVSSVEDYIDYCARMNLPACACTDHGYVMGHYDLFRLSEKKGIKPIPGIEVYLHPGEDYEFNQALAIGRKKAEFAYFHLTLWAMNQQGLWDLHQLSNSSWAEGRVVSRFGSLKARVTWEDLEMFGANLICGTGCVFGPVGYAWTRDEMGEMYRNAERLRRIFQGRLFVEIIPTPVRSDYVADAVSVSDTSGRRFSFRADDMLLTEQGEMTAREAAEAGVSEINDARPARAQECEIRETPDLDRQIEILI